MVVNREMAKMGKGTPDARQYIPLKNEFGRCYAYHICSSIDFLAGCCIGDV